MTGLECLKEELIRRGCNKSQVEAKVVPMILDIVANNNTTVYQDTTEAEKKLSILRERLGRLEVRIADAERRTREAEEKARDAESVLTEQQKDAQTYLKKFEERLMKYEKAEQRDALRTAQTFVNTVKIQTPQNNTAFIIGLASILTGKNIDVEKLERVSLDPDVFYEIRKKTYL